MTLRPLFAPQEGHRYQTGLEGVACRRRWVVASRVLGFVNSVSATQQYHDLHMASVGNRGVHLRIARCAVASVKERIRSVAKWFINLIATHMGSVTLRVCGRGAMPCPPGCRRGRCRGPAAAAATLDYASPCCSSLRLACGPPPPAACFASACRHLPWAGSTHPAAAPRSRRGSPHPPRLRVRFHCAHFRRAARASCSLVCCEKAAAAGCCCPGVFWASRGCPPPAKPRMRFVSGLARAAQAAEQGATEHAQAKPCNIEHGRHDTPLPDSHTAKQQQLLALQPAIAPRRHHHHHRHHHRVLVDSNGVPGRRSH